MDDTVGQSLLPSLVWGSFTRINSKLYESQPTLEGVNVINLMKENKKFGVEIDF